MDLTCGACLYLLAKDYQNTVLRVRVLLRRASR